MLRRFPVLIFSALLLGWAATALGQSAESPAAPDDDPAALRAELERLKSIVPGQAFAMTQIAYNVSNLWFAAEAQNWPLAEFYLNETRVRLRWAIRITPTRRTSGGQLELQPLLDQVENGAWANLHEIVERKDASGFAAGYDALLGSCYGCHVASEKPYLKLVRPQRPAEPLIEFGAH